jgi:ABC-type sugar transport system ATPase subunit
MTSDPRNSGARITGADLVMTDNDPARAAQKAKRDIPVLELRHITKRFGGVVACLDVSLHVNSGEIVALVGNNGAGKSTILRIVSGALPPDSGELLLAGEPVRLRSVREARAHGIEAVPQELALAPKLNVAANIFLGRELLRRPREARLLARRKMDEEARKLIETLGSHIPSMRAKAGTLSGGQRQAIAIARALGWGRSVVVLDEPTAALGVHETSQVEKAVLQMKEMQLGVLLVSHDLDQVFRLADRVYVLYHGAVAGLERPSGSTQDKIVSLITGTAGGDQS